jgi:hypothetical protein
VRAAAARVVEQAEQAAKDAAFVVRKTEPDLADQLNAAVLGTGKGLIHIAGNLTTLRLVSYGFLAQAKELLIDIYQVSEVRDD